MCQDRTGAMADDLNIPVIECANRVTEQMPTGRLESTLKVLCGLPFLTDSTVYLIGVSFCHYHRVIVPAQQMLQ